MKYIITIAQRTYGNIEVEAASREEAKKKALEMAQNDSSCITWLDDPAYQVAEVYRMEEEIEKK